MKLFIALVLLASTQAFLVKNNLKSKISFKVCTASNGKTLKVNSVNVTTGIGIKLHVNIQATALKNAKITNIMSITKYQGQAGNPEKDAFAKAVKKVEKLLTILYRL